MSTFRSASPPSLFLFALVAASVAACSNAPADSAASSSEDHLVSDAASMTQRPDGNWDVVCKDGRHEVASLADILGDKVCGGLPPITCVPKCDARYPSNGECQTFAPDFCGTAPSCVSQCSARYPSNGACQTYVADFCGPESKCITKCAARYPSNGECQTYAPDYCTAGAPTCAKQCVARYPSNGECSTWGEDFCGVGASTCVSNCTARYPSNGECSTYGADFCKLGAVLPTCTKVCAARYPNGNCQTYGPDLCQ